MSLWEVALQNYKFTNIIKKLQKPVLVKLQFYYVWTDNAGENLPVTGCSTKLKKYKFTKIPAKLQKPVPVSLLLCLNW